VYSKKLAHASSTCSHLLRALKDSEAWVLSKRPEYHGILQSDGFRTLFVDWTILDRSLRAQNGNGQVLAALEEMERWAGQLNLEMWTIIPMEDHLERFAAEPSSHA